MELMEIIKSSLSIFATVSFVFILTAYTIFKIKDRTRIKPYLRVNMQNTYKDIILEEVVHQERMVQPVKNELIKINPVMAIKLPPVHERFKIVNTPKTVQKIYGPEPTLEIERQARKIKLNNAKLNIYSLYSETNEKMHKLKLAVN